MIVPNILLLNLIWRGEKFMANVPVVPCSREDFEKRAASFEKLSRWVTSKSINDIPCCYLSRRSTMGNVLDAGGGTGYLAQYLMNRLSISSLTIVDASKNMLDLAEIRIPNAKLINSSIETFCFNNAMLFDTILARQIFHYVDDVDMIIKLLRKCLDEKGLMYVGQFVVCNEESNVWHKNLIQNISKNRKRSFTVDEFKQKFESNGFRILESYSEDYEENLRDFYSRKTNDDVEYDFLMKSATESLSKKIKDSMKIRCQNENMFFTVQFCHLLLEKSGECNEKC